MNEIMYILYGGIAAIILIILLQFALSVGIFYEMAKKIDKILENLKFYQILKDISKKLAEIIIYALGTIALILFIFAALYCIGNFLTGAFGIIPHDPDGKSFLGGLIIILIIMYFLMAKLHEELKKEGV